MGIIVFTRLKYLDHASRAWVTECTFRDKPSKSDLITFFKMNKHLLIKIVKLDKQFKEIANVGKYASFTYVQNHEVDTFVDILLYNKTKNPSSERTYRLITEGIETVNIHTIYGQS